MLVTEGRYRSKQAATEADPFAAVYAAEVPFKRAGKYSILAVTKDGSKTYAAPGELQVVSGRDDRIPSVGDPAPKVETDTEACARGDIASIETRDAALGHARDVRSPTSSARSRWRCCSRRRSCASRASADRWSTSASS